MLASLITLIILIALVIAFAWLTRRAWRARRLWLKVPGILLFGLLTLLFALVTIVIGKGTYDLYRPYPVAAVNVSIAGTPEQLARGERLAGILCASCHTKNGEFPLNGGNNMSGETGLPLGDIYAPNITPAGKIKGLSDADLYRLLRTGITPGGQLTGMNFFAPRSLSDEDVRSIIAYLRKAQSAEGSPPPFSPSPLFAAMVGLGFIAPNADTASIGSVSSPVKAVSSEYGQYVVGYMDCRGCHGPTLTGDAPPPAPPGAANITQIVPKWSKEQFFQTMRTGIDPTGHQVQPPMPWKQIGKLDDVELGALYEFLHGLQPLVKK